MLKYREDRGIVIVMIDYDLAEDKAITFKDDMKGLIDQGKNRFVLDMQNVSLMTSMGRSSLCQINKKLIPQDGWIRLANIDESLMQFINLTSLHDTFDIFESVEQALVTE